MRYAVIENEELTKLALCEMLRNLRPDWELLFTSETIEDTVEELTAAATYPELIFMDIELDDGCSFEIFERINIACPVVFTTSYEDFALQAFEVNSLGYLLKPVTLEKLTKMLVKIEELRRSFSAAPRTVTSQEKHDVTVTQHERILISQGDGYGFLSSDEVSFFTAEDKRITVTLKDGKTYLTEFTTLAECKKVLNPNRFFHISRNIVVNIDSVSKVSKFFKGRLKVEIKNAGNMQTITVSSERKNDFLHWLGHSH